MAQDGKTAATGGSRAPAPRMLFASYHCYLDPSSGAAIATRDLLELLASHGWGVRVFCGPTLDFERRESLAQLLSDQGIAFEERTCRQGGGPSPPAPLARAGEGSRGGTATFSLLHFRQNGVPVSVFTRSGEGGRRLGRQPQPHTMVTPRGKLGLTPQPTTASTKRFFVGLVLTSVADRDILPWPDIG